MEAEAEVEWMNRSRKVSCVQIVELIELRRVGATWWEHYAAGPERRKDFAPSDSYETAAVRDLGALRASTRSIALRR